eukprot:GEMP01003444.1.p1 GENE.GEMP01003444.1~~GEMP01003444.1.p1  ORF type:complete len:1162 (+),score=226.35 GEMP01003444.1:118-3603(+)
MNIYGCVLEGVEKCCDNCCCCCEWCWFSLVRRRRSLLEDSEDNILAQSRRYRWQPQFVKETGVDCHVCGQRFVVDDEVASLPCGCPFHYSCAAKELRRKPRCPKCYKRGLARIASQGPGIRSWLSSFFHRTPFSPFSDDAARSVEMVTQSPSRRYPEWRIISRKKRVLMKMDKTSSSPGGRKDEKNKFSWSIGITASESVMESQYQIDVTASFKTRCVRIFVDGNLVKDLERTIWDDGSLLPFEASVDVGRYCANIHSEVSKDTRQEEFCIDVPDCFMSQHMFAPRRISQDHDISSSPLCSSRSSSSASSLAAPFDVAVSVQRPHSVPRFPKWTKVAPIDIPVEESGALSPHTMWDAWRVQLAGDDTDTMINAVVKVLWNWKTDKLKIFANERLIRECVRGSQEKFNMFIDSYQATILAVPHGHFELIMEEHPNEKSRSSSYMTAATGSPFIQDTPTEDVPLIVPVESAHPVGKIEKNSKLRFIWRIVVIQNCQRVNHRVIVTWALNSNVLRIFINREEKTAEALVTAGSISTPGCSIGGFTLHILHAGGTKLQIVLLPSKHATPCISNSSIMEPLSPESISRLFFAGPRDEPDGSSSARQADLEVGSTPEAEETMPMRKVSTAYAFDTGEVANIPEIDDPFLSLTARGREENLQREEGIDDDGASLEAITPPWVLCQGCRQRWFRAQAGQEDDPTVPPCTNVDGPCCLAAKIPKEPHSFRTGGEKRNGLDGQKASYGQLHYDPLQKVLPSPRSGNLPHERENHATPFVSEHSDGTPTAKNGFSTTKDSTFRGLRDGGDDSDAAFDTPLQSGRSAPESEGTRLRAAAKDGDPLGKGRRRRRLLDDQESDAELARGIDVRAITPRDAQAAEDTVAELRLSGARDVDPLSDTILRLDTSAYYPRSFGSSGRHSRGGSTLVAPESSRLGVGKLFRGSKLKYLWRVTSFDEEGDSHFNRVSLTWSKRSHKVRIFDGSNLIGEHGRRPSEEFSMEVRIGQSTGRLFSGKWRDEFELEVGPGHELLRGMDSFCSQQVPSPTASMNSSFCEDQSTVVSETTRPRHATVTPEFSKVGVGQFHKNSKLKYGWRLHIVDSEGRDLQFLLVLTWSKNSSRVRVMVEDRVLLDRSWEVKSGPFEALFPIGNHAVAVSGDGEDDEFTVRIEDQS